MPIVDLIRAAASTQTFGASLMNIPRGLLIGAALLTLFAACNQQSAPCPETSANQSPAPPAPSATINAPVSVETDSRDSSLKPKRPYVPDEHTAITIAVAVWTPIFGKEQIESERPFKARLQNGVWIVEGAPTEPRIGGTAIAEIAQSDGRIISVFHTK